MDCEIPADMLLSIVQKMQYVFHNNGSHNEPELIFVLNKRLYYFSINSTFLKNLFSVKQL